MTHSRKFFEASLTEYKAKTTDELIDLMPQFFGDGWKLNKARLERADLPAFELKEAFLKALDHHDIERPVNRFVEETEAITDQRFWKTNVCPVTMMYIHDAWSTGSENSMTEFGYEYNV